MTKQNILTIILAVMPSYCALFLESVYAGILLSACSTIGVMLINVYDDDREIREKLRTAWIIHLIGIFVVIAYHNLKN